MKEEFSLFRQEMDVVEAIGLYSIQDQTCLYADEHIGTWAFAQELCQENLASSSEFFHLESDGNRFFGHFNGDHLLVFQLNATKEINIVILEIKTRKLLSHLIKTLAA